jgi:hypothetical protein
VLKNPIAADAVPAMWRDGLERERHRTRARDADTEEEHDKRRDLRRMLTHRGGTAHECARTIAIARAKMKLRANPVSPDHIEAFVDRVHAGG